jgi:ABC-type bacteriocin/lantibiotic exporter with double-glycine peptidase domain
MNTKAIEGILEGIKEIMLTRMKNVLSLTFRISPGTSMIAVLYVLLMSGSIVLGQHIIRYIYESVSGYGEGSASWILWVVVFFVNMTLFGNTDNIENMLTTAASRRVRALYYKLFLFKIYRTKQDAFYRSKVLNEVQFIEGQLDQISKTALLLLTRLSMALFTLILTTASMMVIDWFIIAAVIMMAVMISLSNRYFTQKKIALNCDHMSDERRANYFKSLLTTREHAKEIHLSANKAWFLNKWQDSFQNLYHAKLSFAAKSIILGDCVRIIEALFPYLCALYLVYLLSIDQISSGEAIFLTGLVGTLKWSVKQLIDLLTKDIYEKMEVIEKFENFLGNTMADCYEELEHDQAAPKVSGEERMEPFDEIIVDHVSYTYSNADRPAVRDISLKIKKGEIISILGYNGSGKTTLSKVINGLLHDYEGRVLFNDKDIRDMDAERYYQYFGNVYQDFARYKMSFGENISVGDVEHLEDAARIAEAIHIVNLDDVVEGFANGTDTKLGKDLYADGADLSGGQWQRIAIARACMGPKEILIFDEPTAAIDPWEEENLLQNLRSILNGRTAVLLSHRIGFARLADRIYMMQEGQIVEQGSHEELLQMNGLYSQFFFAQQKLYQQ